MKVALYIDDGLEQIILTPESESERSILAKLHDGDRRLDVKRGQFYECLGGWVRQGQAAEVPGQSTMLVLRRKTAT